MKSPVSMCGVKIGLCLPRSRAAIWVASRPSPLSDASTTYQARGGGRWDTSSLIRLLKD
jgi:hypothetical protein